jgi:hypothetical protein
VVRVVPPVGSTESKRAASSRDELMVKTDGVPPDAVGGGGANAS